MGFGFIMLIEMGLHLFNGKISSRLLNAYQFTYWPFDFVQPLPQTGMTILFVVLAILCILILLGLFYRVSIFFFFLLYTYVFLIDGAYYLNHNYLICLLSFIMMFIPMSNSFALDTLVFKNKHRFLVYGWTVWLLRFMIALPYFFGGVAKLNSDWLHGYPMKIWLDNKIKFPIPAVQKWLGTDHLAIFMSYSGLILDLLIVPLLLFKRTRVLGFILIVSFHLLNHFMFKIDIFPWLMIVATTIFFAPDWPIKWVKRSYESYLKDLRNEIRKTSYLKQKMILLS